MKNRNRTAYLKTLVFAAWVMWPVFGSAQGLPDGEGRDVMIAACTACHGLNNITDPSKKLNAQEWELYLYEMIARGAAVYEEDIETLKQYLISNFAVD